MSYLTHTVTLLSVCFILPVQLEDDGAVHDGETQEANPSQEDTSKHTGVKVQDHHLWGGKAVLVFTLTQTHTLIICIYIFFLRAANRTLPLLSYSSRIRTEGLRNENEVSLQHARTGAGGRFGLADISRLQSSR